jgi:hypothetical protein
VHEYRRRLSLLREQIDGRDVRAASEACGEYEWLAAELAASTGLSGRSRAFTDDAERARLAVNKAIRRAIGRIAEADAATADHPRGSVRTGVRCSYRPASAPWDVAVTGASGWTSNRKM